jgi:hypothetical protein
MGNRAAREKKSSLDNKDSFAYLSKYLNLDFLIEVVVIGPCMKAMTMHSFGSTTTH